jgi:predicted RNase H-like nuclease
MVGNGRPVVAGADGCSGGWAVVVAGTPGPGHLAAVQVVPRFLDVLGLASIVAVDMPIGLPDAPSRACDVEARRRLGWPRRASVFPHLPRMVLGAATHADAVAACRAAGRPAVSVQAWNLRDKVVEVDDALDHALARGVVVVEAHPEVSFSVMAGRPMAWAKRSTAGRAERLAVLGPAAGDLLAVPRPGAAADDVLDAAALAWTASRVAAGEAIALGDGAADARGRPQRVWA